MGTPSQEQLYNVTLSLLALSMHSMIPGNGQFIQLIQTNIVGQVEIRNPKWAPEQLQFWYRYLITEPMIVNLWYGIPSILTKIYPNSRYTENSSKITEACGVSNHQPHNCLYNRVFRRRSEETSKLRETGLCEGNSPGTGEFPAQKASNAENVSIWWHHHENVLQV